MPATSPRQGPPAWTIVDFVHRGWWWNNHGILVLNICLVIPLLTASINGFDSSVVNGLQILPDWQSYFNFPSSKSLGLLTSAQNIGALIALPFTPLCSDGLGRRTTLFLGSVIMLGGVALQCLAAGLTQFIVARGLIGAGLSFACNAAPLLVTELAYPTQRGKITSLYNANWYLGSIIAAWTCYASLVREEGSLWSWRIPSLIQGVGSIAQVIMVWFVPESPRWLIARAREEEASAILAKYHANSGSTLDPLVVFEVTQIKEALRMERQVHKSSSYFYLLSTPGNRRRMMIVVAVAMFSQWSGNGLVSYYINLVLEGVGITAATTKAQINGVLQLWNLISALTAAFLVERLGRRTLFITSNTGMLIVFCMWTLTTALFQTTGNVEAGRATIGLLFIFFFFYDFAYTPLVIAYCIEILPMTIRAKGFAVMNLTVIMTLAFNQFVNPWALDAINWKYYLVYCGWLVFELLFILKFIIETKGRTLEETAALFDGDQSPEDLVRQGNEAATLTFIQMPPRDDPWHIQEISNRRDRDFGEKSGSESHVPVLPRTRSGRFLSSEKSYHELRPVNSRSLSENSV